MNERPKISDNAPIETQVALVVQALGNFMEVTRDTLHRIERKVDLTNGSVAAVQERMNIHDVHHGQTDNRITERLDAHQGDLAEAKEKLANLEVQIAKLISVQHDARVRRQFITWVVSSIVATAAAVPIIYGAWVLIEKILGG